MKLQPTLYAVLLDRAANAPAAYVSECIDKALRPVAGALSDAVIESLREAYIAGLRDGFAQGVAAVTPATNQEDSP
jgi:hypothetical protein